jgi:low affinity Fe/Cu permease
MSKIKTTKSKPFMYRSSPFARFSRASARAAGHPGAFGIAVGSIVIWAALGPLYHFSDTWQLAVNTATTIMTFLMVFLIQNTQNRDCEAVHVKLDELVRALQGAHNALLDLEELSEKDLDKIKAEYEELARAARNDLGLGKSDSGTPELRK